MKSGALHEAIDKRDWNLASDIASSIAGSEWQFQLNRRGLTPLMGAVRAAVAPGSRPCPTAFVELLLQKGPSAAKVRWRHRSASDVAEEGGAPELAALLRAAENATPDPPGAYRCPVCSDKVMKRSHLARLSERVAEMSETNSLVLQFYSPPNFSDLDMVYFHRFTNDPSFKKELTETMGILSHMHFVLSQSLTTAPGTSNLLDHPFHIVDLCSGGTLTAAVAVAMYPNAHVTAVDIADVASIPHYGAASEDAIHRSSEKSHPINSARVHYARLDILSPLFPSLIQDIVDGVGLPTLVFGMHCCGNLSVAAAKLYASMARCRGVFLVPCCLPARHLSDTPLSLYAVDFTVNSSTFVCGERRSADALLRLRWVKHLTNLLENASHTVIPEILSERNTIIWATRF